MKMRLSFQRMLLLTVFAVFCATGASAETRYVAQAGQTPSSGYTSWATAATNIQDAVDAAVSGDVIFVSNGVYDAGGVFVGDQMNRVYISNKKLTLQAVSANPSDTVIAGGGTQDVDPVRCIFVEGASAGNSTINGFTLTNGYARSNGGGLRADYAFTLTNCWVVGCTAEESGGGLSFYRSATVADCVIRNNEANINGGGIEGRNSPLYPCRVNNSWVDGNRAKTGYGGGLWHCLVQYSTISGNTAPAAGGAYRITAYDCAISNNVALNGIGGGLHGNGFLASRCVISSNRASGNGGGVYGVVLTNQCIVANNVSDGMGGGAADVIAFDTVFTNNTAMGEGGGLSTGSAYNRAYSTNCLFVGNRSLVYGGGQHRGIAIDCTFSNNIAMQRGGAGSYLDADGCSFVGNIATNDAGFGGALYYGAAANCRFISNVAKQGGGAYRSVLVNSLLARNHALEYSGAVHGTTAVLLNCTVANNTVAGTYGGAFHSAEIIATNCIVWANIQLSDGATNNWGYDSRVRFAHCLISPLPTGGTDGGGNIAVNPRFVDEGGGDYRLRASSPCVNAGMNLDWMVGAVDLDGQPRIFPPDGLVDLGAFERIPGNTATILTLR